MQLNDLLMSCLTANHTPFPHRGDGVEDLAEGYAATFPELGELLFVYDNIKLDRKYIRGLWPIEEGEEGYTILQFKDCYVIHNSEDASKCIFFKR